MIQRRRQRRGDGGAQGGVGDAAVQVHERHDVSLHQDGRLGAKGMRHRRVVEEWRAAVPLVKGESGASNPLKVSMCLAASLAWCAVPLAAVRTA